MFHDYSKTLLAQITATISPFVFSAPRPVAQALLIAQVASYQSRTIKCGILLSTDHSPDSLTSRIDGWSISPAPFESPGSKNHAQALVTHKVVAFFLNWAAAVQIPTQDQVCVHCAPNCAHFSFLEGFCRTASSPVSLSVRTAQIFLFSRYGASPGSSLDNDRLCYFFHVMCELSRG